MVYVTRLQDWFLITNDKGGYGRFTLSADSEYLYVYDLEGCNIIEDVYQYCLELSKQMGLKVKAVIENPRLAEWLIRRIKNDCDVEFDRGKSIITGH